MRVHYVRAEIHAPAAFQRGAGQDQETAVFIGVAGVQRGTGIQRVGLDQIYARRRSGVGQCPRQLRAPYVDAVFMTPDDDAQPLQRLDPGGLDAVAPDLSVEGHKQPHVVTPGRELA